MADVPHNQLTGSIAIHPAAYVQSSNPGAVGANKLWIDTTTTAGVLNRRNSGDSAFVAVGSAMTTIGDIEYGASGGNRTRLAATTNGYQLVLASGIPAWVPATADAIVLSRTCF